MDCFAEKGGWTLVEIEKVSEFIRPLGWVLNVPSGVVGGERCCTERSVGDALVGEVWRNRAPSVV